MREPIYTSHLIIFVVAAIQVQANNYITQVFPGAFDTFVAPASPSGQLPATHYWIDTVLTPAEETQVRGKLNQLTKQSKVVIFDGNTMTTDAAFAQMGLQLVMEP